MYGLDLFTGIGGITLALKEWVTPVAYCEIDRYCQGVLLSRMADGLLPMAPIWDDIKTFPTAQLPRVDIVYGGFPCQDVSHAGLGAGLDGEQSGLFFQALRIIKETKPTFVFLENVPGIRTKGAERVGKLLASAGYDCRWNLVSAQEVGENHIRKRWFLLAYSNSLRLREKCREKKGRDYKGQRQVEFNSASSERFVAGTPERKAFPIVARANDGIPYSVDRAKSLGNAVVPEQVKEAIMVLLGVYLNK